MNNTHYSWQNLITILHGNVLFLSLKSDWKIIVKSININIKSYPFTFDTAEKKSNNWKHRSLYLVNLIIITITIKIYCKTTNKQLKQQKSEQIILLSSTVLTDSYRYLRHHCHHNLLPHQRTTHLHSLSVSLFIFFFFRLPFTFGNLLYSSIFHKTFHF